MVQSKLKISGIIKIITKLRLEQRISTFLYKYKKSILKQVGSKSMKKIE